MSDLTLYSIGFGFFLGIIIYQKFIKKQTPKIDPASMLNFEKEVEPGHLHTWHDFGGLDPITSELVLHKACEECGCVAGLGGFLNDSQLKNFQNQIRQVRETRAFKEQVIEELAAKYWSKQIDVHAFAAEAVEKGMTLTRDMAVMRLQALSEEMKRGQTK